MDNLTQLHKVIRPHTGLAPLEGYALVVYEQFDGSGAEFRGVLHSGHRFQKPKTGFLRWSARNYFAIAVNLAPELRLTFSEHFTLDDQIHDFDLSFDLSYHVTEPERVATARNDDPLRQLRDEIIRVIGQAIIQSPWEQIRRHFRSVEQTIRHRTEDAMHAYAVKLGFGVTSIALRARLREQDVAIDRATEGQAAVREKLVQQHVTEDFKHQREQSLHEAELAHRLSMVASQDRVDSFEQRQQLRQAMTEASVIAMHNVGRTINTPAELRDGFHVVWEVLSGGPDALAASGVQGPSESRLLGGMGRSLLLGAGQQWIELLTQALTDIHQWRYPFEQRRTLSAVILHLVAELLLDDRADEEKLKQYAEEIFTLARRFSPPLSADQNTLLTYFKNYEQLRAQFK